MMKRLLKPMMLLSLFVMVWGKLVAAEPDITIASMDRGRDFGLTIGDELTHRYKIVTSPHYVLSESSLPSQTKLNYWLDLKQVNLEQKMADGRHIYYLTLVYQTFYAPLDVRTLTIDPIRLEFTHTQDSQQSSLTLPAWQFSMSPIKAVTSRGVGRDSNANEFMRGTINPELINTDQLQSYLYESAVVFLFSMIVFLWLSGWLPFLQRSPFIRAAKAIRKQLKQPHQQATYQNCLMLFHQALNRRAGFTVFISNLDLLFTKYPQFKRFEEELGGVLMSSRKTFFLGEKVDSSLISKTIQLCEKLALADKV